MLAKEGEYVYGPGDMERKGERYAALFLSTPLNLFGHGKAVLKPVDTPPPNPPPTTSRDQILPTTQNTRNKNRRSIA